jgi:hypothetical protein
MITTTAQRCNDKWDTPAEIDAGKLDARSDLRQSTERASPKMASKMREVAMARDFTPHQQKIIKRYYDNQDTIQRQRLAELVSELFLSEGKKRQRTWKAAAATMVKLGIPQSRIDHLLKQDNPALVAEVVKELEGKP